MLEVTFVVKQSLVNYPVFRHVLGSRNPIAVTRDNPREDFQAVIQRRDGKTQQRCLDRCLPQTKRSLL